MKDVQKGYGRFVYTFIFTNSSVLSAIAIVVKKKSMHEVYRLDPVLDLCGPKTYKLTGDPVPSMVTVEKV